LSRGLPPGAGEAPVEVSNIILALAALSQLGGATKFVDIEDVALEAFKVAPDRFGWRTKKRYPSWERVRTSFVHANQNEQRRGTQPLVVSNTEGSAWKLTAEGVNFVRNNAAKAEAATGRKRSPVSQSSPSARRTREIRNHSTFQKFMQGAVVADIERYELADMLVCPPDSSASFVKRKIDSALAAARDVEDGEVERFLADVSKEVGRKWA
jgi:hypothetical protein